VVNLELPRVPRVDFFGLEPRQLGVRELAAVNVHAAELGAAVELRKDFARVQDLGGVEGAFHALLLLEIVLVEHRVHEIALLDADAVLAR
jgi:hypothetical protein